MRGFWSFAIAALVFVAAPLAQSRAAEYRGAIAVSLTDDNLSWGWATNYPTQSRADRNASRWRKPLA